MWQTASSSEVSDFWQSRGLELMNNFGSTAFATWVLVPRAGEPFARGSLGRAAAGFEVRSTALETRPVEFVPDGQPGRMAVRGVTGLTYWNRPALQRRDVVEGWTMVDDLIAFDAHGNADYLGRTDFLISSAGYKIAPVEVETVLCRHPSVREVAVVGAPDPIRQEIVSAFVAVQPGTVADDALRRELQSLVKSKLSPYKYPRRIEFIDALPRDGVGKVQTRILAERMRDG
jgi:2-aminobenzoate-CoA ligase